MQRRPLGRTGLHVSCIGFGAFKIGRNQKVKYASTYELPSESEAERLLNGVLDLGINHIDTAPAYGVSEERIGRLVGHRRGEFVLSTKVGERFENGESRYDFRAPAVRSSVLASLDRLRTDVLDVVFVHANGDDLAIQRETDVVGTLLNLKSRGVVRAVGFSGKTVEGGRAALAWADVLMLELHLEDGSMEPVIVEAERRDVGVVVKKPLASGRLGPAEALRYAVSHTGVTNAVVGSLDLGHLRSNVAAVDGLGDGSHADQPVHQLGSANRLATET